MSIPVGTVISYMGDASPVDKGWIMCDGRSISTTDYPELWDAIQNSYGSSGTGYFNVPDLRGMFLRGADPTGVQDPDSASRTSPVPGDTSIVAAGTVGSRQGHQLLNHVHQWDQNYGNITDQGNDINVQLAAGSPNRTANLPTQPATLCDGGGGETRPSNVYVNYLIYAGA
jgi:microcystin-dependent protein